MSRFAASPLYWVPARQGVTLEVTLSRSVSGDSEHETWEKSGGC
jgi:hypothetical protein